MKKLLLTIGMSIWTNLLTSILIICSGLAYSQTLVISNLVVTSACKNNCTVAYTATLTKNTGSDILIADYILTATAFFNIGGISDAKTAMFTFNNIP